MNEKLCAYVQNRIVYFREPSQTSFEPAASSIRAQMIKHFIKILIILVMDIC